MYQNLEGKVVFITGASAGIGEAIARQFVESGSKVVLTSRRLNKLQDIQNSLLETHPNAKIHIAELDVRDAKRIDELLAALPDEFKAIDIVVNNAGLALGVNATHQNIIDDIDVVIDTNVKGVLYILRAIVPSMIQRTSGHVINISSVAGIQAYKGGSVYCASKHAVQAITTTLRKEVNQFNIRVTSIMPGLVGETEFSVVRLGDEGKAKDVYKGYQALGPNDIADTVLFCASRPQHVQIAEMLIFPTAQSSAELVHKVL